MAPNFNPDPSEARMAEGEKQKFDAKARAESESSPPKSKGAGKDVPQEAASNLEGYSLEILSVWFDP